jgi:bifunctional DNA-binding transcriptional regulator/antitoxin component of YhaV-PrlF toxin-antitoxin module
MEIMKSMITTITVCTLLATASGVRADDQTNKDDSSSANSDSSSGSTTNAASSSRPGFKSQETQTIRATVEKVNKDTREVTLKKDDGTKDTVTVPEAVRNFDQIKPGDMVTAKYQESVAVSVRKSGEAPSATGRESITRAPAGEKPGGERTATMQITASIEKIDRDKRELTLLGPGGNTRLVKVPEDVKRFDDLKEGDQVVITATQSLAIDVSSPQK